MDPAKYAVDHGFTGVVKLENLAGTTQQYGMG